MRKLNNHGLTAVEVLICFSITAVIVVSLFKTINNYKEKQYLESKKNLIATYKNTVTKTIQDDILKNGGIKKITNLDEFNYIKNLDTMYESGDIKITFNFSSSSEENPITATLEIHKNVYENDNDNDNSLGEYISYMDSSGNTEKFLLNDIPKVEFNEPRIDYNSTEGLIHIYVGISDIDLGDKYEVLDLVLPLTEMWPSAYKINSE